MSNPFRSPLWSNSAFVRVWAAASISMFGSLVTRIVLPLVAILTLRAGPIEVAVLRSVELVATLVVGLIAGAWVDRLRRRPILIGADLSRAVLLLSIPAAFAFGALSLWQLLVVGAVTAIITTFFDAADNAYLPTIVERERLVEANGALTASGSVAESAAFGASGFLVQLLTAPIAIAIDALTYLVSAVLLLTIRKAEAPPPPPSEREPVLDEIRHGLRLVRRDPVLRAFAITQMLMSVQWGVFGAIWFLFVLEELALGPVAIGLIAAVGGGASFFGAVVSARTVRRWGVGPVSVAATVLTGVGALFIPMAPASVPVIAIACLVAAQLVGDSAVTVYDVTEASVRQTRVADRELGRVAATFSVASAAAQLLATIGAGIAAELIGLRATTVLAPTALFVAAIVLYRSPVRTMRDLVSLDPRTPAEVVEDVERDQPVGA